MKIIAIGGSNTLMKGGYISELQSLLPETKIINRAIGATNGSMGLYRLMTCDDLSEGDVVIWEYALNNSFGIEVNGEAWHLRILEHTILYAASKGCTILPVVLAHRNEDRAIRPTPYRAMVHHLCASYGITSIDIPTVVRNHFDVSSLPASDWRDGSHYAPGGRVVKLIASQIVDEISAGLRAPRSRRRLYLREGYTPVVRNDFRGTSPRQFSNNILDIKYHDLRDGSVTFNPQVLGGKILSAITLISPLAGKCAIETGSKSFKISMTPYLLNETKTLLRANLGAPSTSFATDPGRTVTFNPLPDQNDSKNLPRGIIAVLTEEPMMLKAPPPESIDHQEEQILIRYGEELKRRERQETREWRKKQKEIISGPHDDWG